MVYYANSYGGIIFSFSPHVCRDQWDPVFPGDALFSVALDVMFSMKCKELAYCAPTISFHNFSL